MLLRGENIMKSLRHFLAVSMVCGTVLLPTVGQAACTLAQMQGVWQAYSVGWDGIQANWARCKLTVNAAGRITTGSCTTSDGTTAPATNGSFALQAANTCTYTGRFTVSGFVNQLRHMTLSRDKESANGIGTSTPPITFVFSLTKL
jgi:hypothetical protein